MESSKERYIPALGYRWLTPAYDFVVAHTTREEAFKQRLLSQADIRDGHRVLDLGCGTGTFAIQIKGAYPETQMFCIDGDGQVLSMAQAKARLANKAVHFFRCFSSHLPFSDRSFDRAVSTLFFHHLHSSEKLDSIREVYRVLRPGGQFHVADWGKPGTSLMKLLFYSIRILDGFENTQDNADGRLLQLIQQAGFERVLLCGELSTVYGIMALYSACKPSYP